MLSMLWLGLVLGKLCVRVRVSVRVSVLGLWLGLGLGFHFFHVLLSQSQTLLL